MFLLLTLAVKLARHGSDGLLCLMSNLLHMHCPHLFPHPLLWENSRLILMKLSWDGHLTQETLNVQSLYKSVTGNRKSEIGLNNTPNDEKLGEGGDHAVPTSFKSTTSRYMTATESAKAKFRSHSNPKSRNPEEIEMPIKPQRRLSQGGTQFSKANSPSTTTWNQRMNTSQVI
jgi:hypothetical protein